jgi:hypothetical protein
LLLYIRGGILAAIEKYRSDSLSSGGTVNVSHIVKQEFKEQFLLLEYFNYLKDYHQEPETFEKFIDGCQARKVNNKIEYYVNSKSQGK